ncbi:unnamed protein product [Closterium sp. NIES-54]
MFEWTANLNGSQIINYQSDPSGKWLALIGIAPGAPEMPGNDTPSLVIAFATKTIAGGQRISRLHITELGDQPGRVPFTKKQADLFFPAAFADDFPIAMQVRKLAFNAFNASPIPTLPNSAAEPPCSPPVFAHRPLPLSPLIQVSAKFGLVYVVTKLGLLFVYDLESATAIYRNRISPDPIFLAADAPSVGGVYAVNLRGKVLLATVNEQAIVPFVSGQLNSPELAISLARRMNLPGAENLVSRSSGRKDVVVAKKSAGSQSPAAAG